MRMTLRECLLRHVSPATFRNDSGRSPPHRHVFLYVRIGIINPQVYGLQKFVFELIDEFLILTSQVTCEQWGHLS